MFMKMLFQVTRNTLLLLLIFLSSNVVEAQKKQSDEIESIVISFLNTSEELTNYSLNGFTSKFTGDFVPISDELEKELIEKFPDYKFYIAKMLVAIDPPAREYDLILVVNTKSKEIKGHIWGEYALIHPSKSFKNILKGYQAKTTEDAIEKVKLVAKLIAFTSNNDKIGDAKVKNGKVQVELIRGEGVFGILEVEINKCLQFDRLFITEPNGKKLRYFV